MQFYETDFGLDKPTTYMFIGGDYFLENFNGYIKNVKFFYDRALNRQAMNCFSDERCDSCSEIGVCTKCKDGHKLVDNRCVCSSINDCLYCSDSKTCDICKSEMSINKVNSPNTCVSSCPDTTTEVNGICIPNFKYIEFISETERIYNQYNNDYYNHRSKLFN